jgi:hypothetical protein
MACYRPTAAWRTIAGDIHWGAEKQDCRPIELPCGNCIGCRQTKQRDWATRCMNEAQMHSQNSFITLTYEGDIGPELNYQDFREFMWRLRSHDRRKDKKAKTRFFMCGEYGEQNKRPHFHALLFGRDWKDKTPIGKNLYESKELNRLWAQGYASVGAVTAESAAYVAGYVTKKYPSDTADRIYSRVDLRTGEISRVPNEFGHMSLKPGIGAAWYDKYKNEVSYARDEIIRQGGEKTAVPKYYQERLKKQDNDRYEHNKQERYKKGDTDKNRENNTTERLETREKIAIQKQKQKVRQL